MSLKITTLNCNGIRDSSIKRNSIFERCRQNGTDILFLQETHIINKTDIDKWNQEWGGKGFWSYGTQESRGVGILFHEKLDVENLSFNHDYEGRIVTTDVQINGTKFRFICIYAPNNNLERKDFIDSLQNYLNTSRKIIMGGDFNFVESLELDKKGGDPNSGNIGAENIKSLKRDFGLIDPFRASFPTLKKYTYIHHQNIAVRLDRYYISTELKSFVQNIDFLPCAQSDHWYLDLTFKGFDENNFVYGPGFWKCNTSILNNENLIQEITHTWESELKVVENKNGLWWEACKLKFKEIIVKHSKKINNELRQKIRTLESDLSFLMTCQQNECTPGTYKGVIETTKSELNSLLVNKLNGSKIRARVEFLEESERPSRYFLAKEKSNNKKKIITCLESNGVFLNNQDEIIQHCRTFYEDLYARQECDSSLIDFFLDGTPKLNENLRESCEGLINKEECLEAIKKMKNDKCPGSDGLPKEFYSKFFHLFGDDYVNMINNCYFLGCLTESQRYGLITLICKNLEKAHLLGFWRPISLLNVDYKILSKTLSLRLRKVLPYIINLDQTCSIQGRSITDSIHLMRNIYDYVEQKQMGCAFINLDQSKAFDRVSHYFLNKTLKTFGFGPSFIKWINVLYNNISSSVIINGFISEPFSVQRSVRQGCSISPMLYVICIEPFALRVRSDPHIKGITLPGSNGKECRIVQFADDNTCVVTTKESIRKVFILSELYGLASGSEINKEKCKGFMLGSWKGSTGPPDIPWVNNIKALGFKFSHANRLTDNWNPILDKFKTSTNIQYQRKISLRAKAIILNTFSLSKLWYIGTCLEMPKIEMQKFEKTMFNFIWNNKTECVKRKTLSLPYHQGGIGLASIEPKLHALRIMHIVKLLFGPWCKWMALAIYWIGHDPLIRSIRPEFASNLIPHSLERPTFYEESLKSIKFLLEICPDFNLEEATTKKVYLVLLDTFTEKPSITNKFPTIQFNSIWPNVLHKFISPELRDLNFAIVHNFVPVNLLLYSRNIIPSHKCKFCNQVESVHHRFITCPAIQQFWAFVQEIVTNMYGGSFILCREIILYHNIPPTMNLDKTDKEMFYLILSISKHAIWIIRNKVTFDRVHKDFTDIQRLFLKGLKNRCIVDSVRLNLEDFVKRWSKGRVICTSNVKGIVDFLI